MTVEEALPQVTALDQKCAVLRALTAQLLEADVAQRQGQADAGALKVLDIKKAHREVCEATEAARTTTAASKEGLEGLSLQLANLLYQKRRHESDIADCLELRSPYTEADIALIPEADFLATAGPQWTGQLDSSDAHEVTKARLMHEAACRQALLAQLQRTRARKGELAAAVAQKRRFAESLVADLGAVRQAAAPLRGALEVAPAGVALPASAAALPLPLYVVASTLLAAQGEFDVPISIDIAEQQAVADPPAAAAAAAQEAAKAEEGGDAEMADAPEPGEAAAEAAEAAAESEGTPEAQPPVAAPAEVATEELEVHLTLGRPDARLLTATFAYAAASHRVLVSGGDADDDKALAAADGPKAGAQPRSTYRWAQQLAGVDFLPPPQPGAPPPTAAMADGHVLAGLAEHRASKRALKTLEALRAAAAAPQTEPAK